MSPFQRSNRVNHFTLLPLCLIDVATMILGFEDTTLLIAGGRSQKTIETKDPNKIGIVNDCVDAFKCSEIAVH